MASTREGFGTAMVESVLDRVEESADELVEFVQELIRIPTVNPPGDHYRDCAETIGGRFQRFGFETELLAAEGRPEHSAQHPRINVVGRRRGLAPRPTVHLNGHFDVVPPGQGWTVDPFSGLVREGRIYGRGSADMKAGLGAALYAAEAIRRAGVTLQGTIEISATVDEESGGWAGAAWLAESGRIDSTNTDFVIIPEPLGVDRICIGHRGAYWFKITAHGRTGHGSMPFLGTNAIDGMASLLERFKRRLVPGLADRETAMPIVPAKSRRATLNINGIVGGQNDRSLHTPCVADRCEAIFDRRFLLEESIDDTRAEIEGLLKEESEESKGVRFALEDLVVFNPVQTPASSPLVGTLGAAIESVLGRKPALVASPGTYDHKHFTQIGGIRDCVAYGPGILEQAHQPDEYCSVRDLVDATKILALAILGLTRSGGCVPTVD